MQALAQTYDEKGFHTASTSIEAIRGSNCVMSCARSEARESANINVSEDIKGNKDGVVDCSGILFDPLDLFHAGKDSPVDTLENDNIDFHLVPQGFEHTHFPSEENLWSDISGLHSTYSSVTGNAPIDHIIPILSVRTHLTPLLEREALMRNFGAISCADCHETHANSATPSNHKSPTCDHGECEPSPRNLRKISDNDLMCLSVPELIRIATASGIPRGKIQAMKARRRRIKNRKSARNSAKKRRDEIRAIRIEHDTLLTVHEQLIQRYNSLKNQLLNSKTNEHAARAAAVSAIEANRKLVREVQHLQLRLQKKDP